MSVFIYLGLTTVDDYFTYFGSVIFFYKFQHRIVCSHILAGQYNNKPEAHGPQRSPECTAMKAIFSQNTVNVACN